MRVSSSPLGAFQPQRRGVRLGKCQARRKVKSACAPGAMVRLRQRAPTGPILADSGPSSPSAEKSSQKRDRKSTRLNSSHLGISYAVFCLKKKKKKNNDDTLMLRSI